MNFKNPKRSQTESGDSRSKSQANALELEAKLKAIVDLVAKNPKNGQSKALDSSDCGSAKRRKVSMLRKRGRPNMAMEMKMTTAMTATTCWVQ